ncbi:hypothetical protein [Maribacter aestuarii]|uniref:hypothetical protein n=1 Tax=Maribacter aestuarii TaxID=1130723 RepID=UPI00248C219D|nr:hypothetical protein [Maribacter aestuarii]
MLLTYLKRFYFPVFVTIAIFVYVAQQTAIDLPLLVNNYLNDLLCMPIVLKICQYLVRQFKSDRGLQIPITLALTLTVLYALYFELLLPKFNVRYTADTIDVLLYFAGALFFIGIERYGAGKTSVLEPYKDL